MARIGHCGYKAAFPENTMAAFRGAVDVGAHAIETDLHLSKDGAVVLSHDATLKRCFGVPRKVADCDWEYLRTLRTLREPTHPMPRLVDLLEYLDQPGQEHMWLLLDIKTDDDSTRTLTCLAASYRLCPVSSTMESTYHSGILGSCLQHLPNFPVALTAFSSEYATALLPVPNLNFNLFNIAFTTCSGSRFLPLAKKQDRLIFSQPDNDDVYMVLSLCNEVDGVITDDPKRFLELCSEWTEKGEMGVRESVGKMMLKQTLFWGFINFFGMGYGDIVSVY